MYLRTCATYKKVQFKNDYIHFIVLRCIFLRLRVWMLIFTFTQTHTDQREVQMRMDKAKNIFLKNMVTFMYVIIMNIVCALDKIWLCIGWYLIIHLKCINSALTLLCCNILVHLTVQIDLSAFSIISRCTINQVCINAW